MTLNDFDSQLPDGQLAKGRNYFRDGQVTTLEEWQPGQWQASVSGSEDYEVSVEFQDKDIAYVSCDCPHDAEYCKHVIAVLYAIREETGSVDRPPKTERAKGRHAKDLAVVVGTVPESQLREFVREYAKKEPAFRALFLARFSYPDGSDQKENYAGLIRNAFDRAGGRSGFVDYQSMPGFTRPVQTLLSQAESAFRQKEYAVAFAIASAVVEELNAALESTDDSRGIAGECIHQGFLLLGQLLQAGDAPRALKDRIFAYMLGEAAKPGYGDFGFDEAWLDILLASELDHGQTTALMQLLDERLAAAAGQAGRWQSNYTQNNLLQKKIRLLLKAGRQEEAQALRLQHLDIPEVRNEIVGELIRKGDYAGAKRLIVDGIALASDQGYPGVVRKFQDLLLRVLQLQEDVPAMRKLATELFETSNYQTEYYRTLKALYDAAEWPAIAEGIIAQLQDYQGLHGIRWRYGNAALAAVYIEEGYWDRLMELVEATPALEFMQRYQDALLPRFPGRLLAAYQHALTKYAAEHADRSHYKIIRSLLQDMTRWSGGREVVNILIKDFTLRYKQRRAMMEELAKVKTG